MAKSNKPGTFTKFKTPYYSVAVFNCILMIVFSISLVYVESISLRVIAIVNVILNTMLFSLNTLKLYSISKACKEYKKFIMEVLGGKKEH